MKITIYELLGLIKDGKAPKKIRVYGEISEDIFTFNKNADVYYDDDCNTLGYKYNLEVMLDSEIEIIKEVEDKEYEDIDSWGKGALEEVKTKKLEIKSLQKYIEILMETQNQLIKNQKKIIERLNK